MNEKNLLVTLADKYYLKQAKQLFSSAYFNAGWSGDYMIILTGEFNPEDKKWFEDKGIIVKEFQPIINQRFGHWAGITLSKYYLFTPEFKKYKKIIYLDADIIIKRKLNQLLKIKKMGATPAWIYLKNQLKITAKAKYPELYQEFKNNFYLNIPTFNAGVLVFDTKIIKEDTFSKLVELSKKYQKLIKLGDETILNMIFCNDWEELPSIYNLNPTELSKKWNYDLEKIKGIIFHFYGDTRPWEKISPFNEEWKNNLLNAEKIDLKNIPKIKEVTKQEEEEYLNILKEQHKKQIS